MGCARSEYFPPWVHPTNGAGRSRADFRNSAGLLEVEVVQGLVTAGGDAGSGGRQVSCWWPFCLTETSGCQGVIPDMASRGRCGPVVGVGDSQGLRPT